MADYIIDRMTNSATMRCVFLLKVVLSASYGIGSLYTTDVRPTWVIASMFLTASVMNVYLLITLKASKLIGVALSLTVGACLMRVGAIVFAYQHGTYHTTSFGRMFFGVMVWLGLAAFGMATTLGAADQLGRGNRARGSDHPGGD